MGPRLLWGRGCCGAEAALLGARVGSTVDTHQVAFDSLFHIRVVHLEAARDEVVGLFGGLEDLLLGNMGEHRSNAINDHVKLLLRLRARLVFDLLRGRQHDSAENGRAKR